MLELSNQHLDDFTLLRYVADDLDASDRVAVSDHLGGCSACQATYREIEELDEDLKAIARDPSTRLDLELEELEQDDPFRQRPNSVHHKNRHSSDPELGRQLLAFSEEGSALSEPILEAVDASDEELKGVLARLRLDEPSDRFALLYALQEAGRRIAKSPRRFTLFAEEVIRLANRPQKDADISEIAVPLPLLLAQAHQLLGQACLWTGKLETAKIRFELAYRSFGIAGDIAGIAVTEQFESQRRAFVGKGAEGLALVRRARLTFEEMGLEDYIARTRVVEGMSLSALKRFEEAAACYRLAIPTFESRGLWSNYVGAVNGLGTMLNQLGRVDEARREYARALRRLSRSDHASWVGIVRLGLAEVLLSAGRYRQAAASSAQAARSFASCGLTLYRLKAALFEIESWVQGNQLARARSRFETFSREVAGLGGLDREISRQIDEALSGSHPNYQRVSELRREAVEYLELRLDANA